MSTPQPNDEALRKALSDEIVYVALRIKTTHKPVTPSTFTDHVAAGREILGKHHEGLDKLMALFAQHTKAAVLAGQLDTLTQVYYERYLADIYGQSIFVVNADDIRLKRTALKAEQQQLTKEKR